MCLLQHTETQKHTWSPPGLPVSPSLKIGHHPIGCMCVFVCVRADVTLISFTHVLCFKTVGSLPLSGLARLLRTCPIIRKWAWPCPYKVKWAWWEMCRCKKPQGPGVFLDHETWPQKNSRCYFQGPKDVFFFWPCFCLFGWLMCMCHDVES